MNGTNTPRENSANRPSSPQSYRIALIGNPNTGKTTLFNALTGLNQRVGNYPGVTVERKVGRFTLSDSAVEVIDLPGSYSLAARSPDEMVLNDVLLGKQKGEPPIDLALVIVDASNLRRNLYLLSQILELGLPTVVALNMIDLANAKQWRIDAAGLSNALGVPVVEVCARRNQGVDRLKEAIGESLRTPQQTSYPAPTFPEAFQEGFNQFKTQLEKLEPKENDRLCDIELFHAMIDEGGYIEQRLARRYGMEGGEALRQAREVASQGQSLAAIETKTRYDWIARIIDENLVQPEKAAASFSDRIDRILTHRVWGTLIFLGVMVVIFQSIYSWAMPFMEGIEEGVAFLGAWAGSLLPEGALRSLVVDGAIAGVGAVIVFVPQIAILFLFIAILEDCGYMPRAAYLMDRLLAFCGLSGRSFIPLASSFACAVPGVMATRTIEDRSDRFVTILVAPLMSCSARLPVYLIFIAAFIPSTTILGGWLNLQGITLLAMYLVGVIVAIPVALLLRGFVFRSESSSFMLEMPSYKIPSPRSVALYIFERVMAFLQRAGVIIFCAAIVIWALSYFPRSEAIISSFDAARWQTVASFSIDARPFLAEWNPDRYHFRLSDEELIAVLEEDDALTVFVSEDDASTNDLEAAIAAMWQSHLETVARLNAEEAGELVRNSYLGRMGRWIEPAVAPLGWDWRIGMGAIASFPAREVIIATLGTIFNLADADEDSIDLRNALQNAVREDGRPLFSIAVALSIMVFFALCSQCVSTLAVIRRETNTWRWPIFSFVYMTLLAYLGAMAVYQLASLAGLG